MARALALLLVVIVCSVARSASADEVAPSLVQEALRTEARVVGMALLAQLPRDEKRRLVGTYVAVSADAADPAAFAACDDDGDHVLVVSDAMLSLVADVARAASFDEANGSHKIAEHADFLARAQVPGRRLLPPPPGFYTAEIPGTTADARRHEALAFVLARALAVLRGGDVVCAHPTATRERGDAEWTRDEDRRARAVVAALSHGNDAQRDAAAATMVRDLGASADGALALLAFSERLELQRATTAARFAPSYVLHHPGSAVRAATVRAAFAAAR